MLRNTNKMTTNMTKIVECTIRTEIEDWFKNLINVTFGADIQLQYLLNDEHFDIHTHVKIIANERRIKEIIDFIGNTSDLLHYKLPWLKGNTYYVLPTVRDSVKAKLLKIMNETDYFVSYYNITGCPLHLLSFRPDLNDREKLEIDEVFKTLPHNNSLFITYPKMRVARTQSSFHMAMVILRGYHGAYLKYLNLEDILSLEIANNDQEAGGDGHLHHDIQMFLRNKYPQLYEGERLDFEDFNEFRKNEVLRYFIKKYHKRFETIYISNILTADEIDSLSQSYNIKIAYNNLTHIDFKSTNSLESVDFCAMFHFDPDGWYFLNYGSKCTGENHVIHFNADDSLDPIKCSTDFSYLIIKSHNNCSPQKSNAILKCVTEHFRACQNNRPSLLLYKFDMNFISKPNITSLLRLMRQGRLQFHQINFNFKTLVRILEQSDETWIRFFKCHISVENVNVIPINSKKSQLEFYDMDVDLNLLCSFNNLKYLEFTNCGILSTSWDVPTITDISSHIWIEHVTCNVATLLRLLIGLRSAPDIFFLSCNLTPGNLDLANKKYFHLRNKIKFQNMSFRIETLFELFEICEIENRIRFKNCHFQCETVEPDKFRLKPVKIEFYNTRFDLHTLLTLLTTLNNESEIWIANSFVLPLAYGSNVPTKIVTAKYVHFINCKFETNTLLNILGKMSQQTRVHIDHCNVLRSSTTDPTMWPDLLDVHIEFRNTKIESQIATPILRTNSYIIFENCSVPFMTDAFFDISIKAHIAFVNMIFDSSNQLRILGNFAPKTAIHFEQCHFKMKTLKNFNLHIKPLYINFEKTSIDLEVLLTIMKCLSKKTKILIDACVIRTVDPLLDVAPIKINELYFLNMSLQIQTILCILKGFTKLFEVGFKNCKILCANRDELPNIKLKPSVLHFAHMLIDVEIIQSLVLQCVNGVAISLNNCKIKSSSMLENIGSVDISCLTLKNVTYSQEVLQFFQCLGHDCSIIYLDQLSNQAIIEICTKSHVHGSRLLLNDHFPSICTKSFYFELFAEFYRSKVLVFEFDSVIQFDLPTYLIPRFENDINFTRFDWSEFKIKFVEVNDFTVKVEFLKNGKVIDLFYELNDLSDDSDDCVVDYY